MAHPPRSLCKHGKARPTSLCSMPAAKAEGELERRYCVSFRVLMHARSAIVRDPVNYACDRRLSASKRQKEQGQHACTIRMWVRLTRASRRSNRRPPAHSAPKTPVSIDENTRRGVTRTSRAWEVTPSSTSIDTGCTSNHERSSTFSHVEKAGCIFQSSNRRISDHTSCFEVNCQGRADPMPFPEAHLLNVVISPR